MPRTIARQVRGKRVTMAPAKVAISPGADGRRGMSTITYDAGSRLIDRVAITGGKDPYKSFAEADALYYEKPSSTVVIFADGGFETFFGPDCDLVRVYGGAFREQAKASRRGGPSRKAKDAPVFSDVLGCYYREGMNALAGVTEEIVGDALTENPRYRGSFDKYQTYQLGDLVIYPPTGGSWRTYVARRQVTPPWFPAFFSGDVPGKSDAWELMPALPHGPDVLGAVRGYEDYATIYAVQTRIDAMAKALPDGDARKTALDPKGIDGDLGPNTSAAVREYQRLMGMTQTGIIDDALLQKLTLPSPGVTVTQRSPKTPSPKAPTAPSPDWVPGGPAGLSVASPPWEIGGVPAWQIGVGVLASAALGYGVYRAAKR